MRKDHSLPHQSHRDLLPELAGRVKRLLSCDRVSLFLLSEDRQTLSTIHVNGVHQVVIAADCGSIVGEAVVQDRTINLAEASAHPQFDAKVDHLTGYTTRSMLVLPIREEHNRDIFADASRHGTFAQVGASKLFGQEKRVCNRGGFSFIPTLPISCMAMRDCVRVLIGFGSNHAGHSDRGRAVHQQARQFGQGHLQRTRRAPARKIL